MSSSAAFAIPPDLTRDTGTLPGDGPIRFGSDEHMKNTNRSQKGGAGFKWWVGEEKNARHNMHR